MHASNELFVYSFYVYIAPAVGYFFFVEYCGVVLIIQSFLDVECGDGEIAFYLFCNYLVGVLQTKDALFVVFYYGAYKFRILFAIFWVWLYV